MSHANVTFSLFFYLMLQLDNLEYDVARGETQFQYFQDHADCNDILRKVMSAFVSQNRSLGYVQGMTGGWHLHTLLASE